MRAVFLSLPVALTLDWPLWVRLRPWLLSGAVPVSALTFSAATSQASLSLCQVWRKCTGTVSDWSCRLQYRLLGEPMGSFCTLSISTLDVFDRPLC